MTNTPEKPTPVPVREAEGERDEAFLRRWSRRKHAARAEEPAATPARAERVEPPQPPEKILTDADMPPIESLNEQSDFSMFLSSGVSEALRRQALRKLFTLPSVNQRCPLDSEWYDCRNTEALGNIITHDMREEMAREAQKLKDAALSALSEENTSAEPATTSADSMAKTTPAPESGGAAVDGENNSGDEGSTA